MTSCAAGVSSTGGGRGDDGWRGGVAELVGVARISCTNWCWCEDERGKTGLTHVRRREAWSEREGAESQESLLWSLAKEFFMGVCLGGVLLGGRESDGGGGKSKSARAEVIFCCDLGD